MNDKKYRVLELYSGIGGMHQGLKLSKLNGEIVAAVDINPHACNVYSFNFPGTTMIQKTIEGIKLEEFESLNFDMILMSPPCQPFTRQGNQNGINDNRAKSFLTLIDLIPLLSKKPTFILMENVKGFDHDEARIKFLQMLSLNKYYYQEFLLSPIQFGLPNSRLRYFLIARLNERFCFETTQSILTSLPIKMTDSIEDILKNYTFDLNKIKKDLNVIKADHENLDQELVGTVKKITNQ